MKVRHGVGDSVSDEVSTGSGSDRVTVLTNFARREDWYPVATAPGTDSVIIDPSHVLLLSKTWHQMPSATGP
jgi:hypothetical protein